jgi:peptide/nickel transport system substrate-binding protein
MAPTVQRFRFEAGDLDAVGELGTGDMALFQRDPRWASLGSFDAEKEVWGEAMNTEVPPFDNVEVRRAVASVIDRSKYARLRPGTVRPLRQLLPPAVPMFEPDFEGQPTNLAEALEHMKKAGFPFDPATGRGGYPHEIPYYAHAQSFGETTGQILAQELAQIGLRLKIRIVSYPTYLALTRRRHQVPMSAQGWQQDYPDPSDFFDSMFHSKAIADEDSNNVSFYSNPKLDSLLDAAKKTLDSTKRAPLYAEANRILRDDAPWAFTHAVRRFEVHQPRLRQYGHHPVWTHFVLRSFLDPGVLPTASRHAWERLTRPSPPSHGLALRAGEPR